MSQKHTLPVPLLARSFTTAEARELGVPPSRLRAHDLAHPFHGVHSLTSHVGPTAAEGVDPLLDSVAGYQARMAPDEFFSHSTAARLLGMPLPRAFEGDRMLHVAVVAPAHPPQSRHVRGHRLSTARVIRLSGKRVSDPVSTWCQLATQLPVDDLVAVGDFIVTGPDPLKGAPALATLEDLSRTSLAATRRPGARRLRQALPLVRIGAYSRKETQLRLLFVGCGLPEPALNHPVVCRDGVERLLDLAYPHLRLGFEYEGDWHRTDRRKFRSDITRHEHFADVDWDRMRVTEDDLATAASRATLELRIRHRIANRTEYVARTAA
ncbi:hypothetical protein OSC27_10360 [Microbacterium sp. STN6]|uniref:hypothetical protein n=1 Tax=Microbacterium sp. STN6 TaxID=2995588 RepID=UPI002260A46F|nr:hypothetical protein [Microbacterium sp. STN6]MCX7522678.1 hypothetical protein [Microbacterium sp. STN6]